MFCFGGSISAIEVPDQSGLQVINRSKKGMYTVEKERSLNLVNFFFYRLGCLGYGNTSRSESPYLLPDVDLGCIYLLWPCWGGGRGSVVVGLMKLANQVLEGQAEEE